MIFELLDRRIQVAIILERLYDAVTSGSGAKQLGFKGSQVRVFFRLVADLPPEK